MTAVIAYDQPVANFIDALSRTGHVTHTAYRKTSVTFHHNAGRLSLQGILDVWKTRPASAHFQSDGTGKIGQYVKVNEYAWATGNTLGNKTSISIEMANATLSPDWTVADATWKSAARLAGWLHAKVLGVRPSRATCRMHMDWKATGCPGPYIQKILNSLISWAQKAYDYFVGKPAQPTAPKPGADRALTKRVQTALEVTADGLWGSATDLRARQMRTAARSKTGYPKPTNETFDVRMVQGVIDTAVDGVWGPNSQRALEAWVKSFQSAIGVTPDGQWGPTSDTRFLKVRADNLNNF